MLSHNTFSIIISAFTEFVPFGILFSLFVLGPSVLSIWNKWKLTKTQIKELDLREDESISINFSTETFFDIRSTIPFPNRGAMYIRDKFIFICPRTWGWLSGANMISLPIILTKDVELIKPLTKINNIYLAEDLKVTKDGSIEIVFKSIKDFSATTHFYIDLIDEVDWEKIKPLTMWQ